MRLLMLLWLVNPVCLAAQEVGIIMGTARQMVEDGVEQTLIRLKEMGVMYLEGANMRGISREEYKKLLDKHGLQIIANGISFDRLEQSDSIAKAIDLLKFFGAQYAVCYWIPHERDNFLEADLEKGIAVFNTAGKQFAGAGLSLVYHPHGYEFKPHSAGGTMFDYFVMKTDPRYVNFQIDVFWVRNPGQNPTALMRKYPGRFPLTHLKDRMHGTPDNHFGRQDREKNVVLGSGDVNIAEVMRAARETGVKYHLIEDESSRAMVQLPMHLSYLRSLDMDRTAVELSVDLFHRSMLKGDSLQLANLTADELSYGHSNGTIDDRDFFVSNTATGRVKVWHVTDQEVVVKGQTAYVRHTVHGEIGPNDSGQMNVLDLKVLQVWVKDGGIWKLLARQAVRI